MNKHHISIDAWNCVSPRLKDNYAIDWFLRQIASLINTKILHGPNVVSRTGPYFGMSGSLITDTSHVAIHTFPGSSELTVDILSYEKINESELRDMIIKYFDLSLDSIKFVNFSGQQEQYIQCEEPGCTRKATKIWGGRKVCNDHYDYYRDQELRPELYDDYID
jgi:S-adenosylmethionine/arginine decarboxylase-like enzyme